MFCSDYATRLFFFVICFDSLADVPLVFGQQIIIDRGREVANSLRVEFDSKICERNLFSSAVRDGSIDVALANTTCSYSLAPAFIIGFRSEAYLYSTELFSFLSYVLK